MDKLIQRFQELLANTDTRFFRYLHTVVDWKDRMKAIVGVRGVGKTTLLLQHIKSCLPVSECLYVSADDFYFTEHRILDFAEEFHRLGGKYLFIHQLPGTFGNDMICQLPS